MMLTSAHAQRTGKTQTSTQTQEPEHTQDAATSRLTAEKELPISVLVIDDHPIVRMGVSVLLAQTPDIKVVDEASSCAQGFDLAQKLRPDIVVGDMNLEDGNACDLMHRLQAEGIDCQVIVYTAHADEVKVLSALRAGASGYIVKGSNPERLLDAIHTVAAGGSYLDPVIASRVIGRVGRTQERRASHSRDLTERETSVLIGMVQGKRNKEIASDLFISERTVKYHINGVFTKLRVKNRTQAVRAAIEQGLVSV